MITLIFLISFNIGEKLEYTAKFSFITVGKMTLEIKDTVTCDSMHCYHLQAVINSNPSLNFLFSLNDTFKVYTQSQKLQPVFYEERINESGYHKHTRLLFNYDRQYVTYNDSLQYEISTNTRDLVSFWYYLRTIPLNPGDTIKVNIHKSMKNYEILCPVIEERKIKVPKGEFNTTLVSPLTKGKGIFGAGGAMEIWYSSDEAHYPVQIKAKMKIGSVLFKLKEVND